VALHFWVQSSARGIVEVVLVTPVNWHFEALARVAVLGRVEGHEQVT